MRQQWIADQVATLALQPRDLVYLRLREPMAWPASWSLDEPPVDTIDTKPPEVMLERVLVKLEPGVVVMAWRYDDEVYLPFPL